MRLHTSIIRQVYEGEQYIIQKLNRLSTLPMSTLSTIFRQLCTIRPTRTAYTAVMPRLVVAAAIVDSLDNPTQLLCAARSYPPELAGKFELPGGKIDRDETPLQALHREIREEMNTVIRVGAQVMTEEGTWWPILQGRTMGVWLAELAPDAPAPTLNGSHSEFRWTPLDKVNTLDWIGHDLEIALAVARTCGFEPADR